MTAVTEPPVPGTSAPDAAPALDRAAGVELLGPVSGSGYRNGACLVRRADGQMVQLGAMMYALLEEVDGRRRAPELAEAVSATLGRRIGVEHVARLAEKLAEQGLLAGTEINAPPRRNPLLALRFKVLVTNPKVTGRLVAPFTFLFRPWVMWPVLASFGAVFWFVLIDKGVAGATAQAFNQPALLLLVFALAVVSAGFHELGHAAACRYGGATPGGMGMGLYLVWPAFYTDVTDTYRLPKRARLRVDLAGLYFNTVVAVATMAVWLVWRQDALLLLVALQILQMVKQLSPIIRADGYHILADATGIPDLYAHMGPTMKRLIPGRHREPSALRGRARLLVTVWVLVVVPVLLSLMASAVLLLPRLITTAWNSGRHIAAAMPADISHGRIVDFLAAIIQLAALVIPVGGSLLVTQKSLRMVVGKARAWSAGRPARRLAVFLLGAGVAGGLAYAWWPSGQYQPVRPGQPGTIPALGQLLSSPGAVVRPAATPSIPVGTHLAVAMIPVGGPTAQAPALYVIPGAKGHPATAVYSANPADPSGSTAVLFPFKLPSAPGPNGQQALALGTQNGAVVYDVEYGLVTFSKNTPVDATNSAFALAHCQGCTTVAVSFQLVLVVGQAHVVDPINAAGALNYDCPACTTTAIADQMVVTLDAQPSQQLVGELDAALAKLGQINQLGAGATPSAVAADVAAVQTELQQELDQSGIEVTTTTAPETSGSGGTSEPGTSPTTLASSDRGTDTATTTGSGTTGSATSPTTATTASGSDSTGTTNTPETTTATTSPTTVASSPPTSS